MMTNIFAAWLEEFNALEKKLREGSDSNQGYANYTLEEAAPHIQRDLNWLLAKLPNDPYAKMETARIKYHIIGLVLKERTRAKEEIIKCFEIEQ